MKLIGMLDSPFVRRTVVSAHLMHLALDHEQISVFRQFDQFRALNPLVKAPTLVFDDGTVMVESQIILQYLETLAAPKDRLTPADPAARQRCLRLTSVALAACDRSVQRYYETSVRPEVHRWLDWTGRVTEQLLASYDMLEAELGASPWLCGNEITQADVTTAVAWRFTQTKLPGIVDPAHYPRLAALSAKAEALPAFQAADY
ncbi:glutathione S-transferase family protein [Denitromonas iodatirespirans]|uniref:Glutathione S-transferase family protein n=1 Tax=Denitromonas iodatirespirans TaxID=2795389 RepID=A0A944H818_DENI1|nr:glutathione S-transferase family protein [Denitromonas iodatirespirans]MBT0961823.1 glutathione S-transferase family protein [Denitromonas iodatirespirans]